MSEAAALKQNWSDCTPSEIAWIGLSAEMKSIGEVAEWLLALAYSGGCGCRYGQGDAFSESSNALATWVASLSEKLKEIDSKSPHPTTTYLPTTP